MSHAKRGRGGYERDGGRRSRGVLGCKDYASRRTRAWENGGHWANGMPLTEVRGCGRHPGGDGFETRGRSGRGRGGGRARRERGAAGVLRTTAARCETRPYTVCTLYPALAIG